MSAHRCLFASTQSVGKDVPHSGPFVRISSPVCRKRFSKFNYANKVTSSVSWAASFHSDTLPQSAWCYRFLTRRIAASPHKSVSFLTGLSCYPVRVSWSCAWVACLDLKVIGCVFMPWLRVHPVFTFPEGDHFFWRILNHRLTVFCVWVFRFLCSTWPLRTPCSTVRLPT